MATETETRNQTKHCWSEGCRRLSGPLDIDGDLLSFSLVSALGISQRRVSFRKIPLIPCSMSHRPRRDSDDQ